jgi:hypothetical protein
MPGNSFFMDIGKVMEAAGKFGQQKSLMEQSQGIVKGFGPKVVSGWIGGDADEHNLDIGRKLMPRFADFAMALAGIQSNLTKATEAAQGGDKKASSLAQGFADEASKIYP